jgi:hypothetical protein
MSRSGGNILEEVAIVGVIDPDAYGTGDQTSTVIDMRYWREISAIVMGGTLGTSATLDITAATSAASNMGSPTTLTAASITALTEAGTDSDKQAQVRVTQDDVAVNGANHRYIQFTATLTAATSDYAVLIIGTPARYSPVSEFDLTAVDELVQ